MDPLRVTQLDIQIPQDTKISVCERRNRPGNGLAVWVSPPRRGPYDDPPRVRPLYLNLTSDGDVEPAQLQVVAEAVRLEVPVCITTLTADAERADQLILDFFQRLALTKRAQAQASGWS